MKNKIVLGVTTLLMLVAFLTGCGKSVKGESEIKKDLLGKEIPIHSDFLDGTKLRQPDELKSFKIAKRQTNKKDKQDIVYADVTFKDKNADISGQLVLSYNYYDQGGWVLDSISPVADFKITPTERVTDAQLKEDMKTIWGSASDKEEWDIKVIKSEFKDVEKNTQDILNLEITRKCPNSTTTSQFDITYELNAGYGIVDKNKPYQWVYKNKNVLSEGKPQIINPLDISNEEFKKSIIGMEVTNMLGTFTDSLKESDIKSVEIDKSTLYTDDSGQNAKFSATLEFADGFVGKDSIACSDKKVTIVVVQYEFKDGKWTRLPSAFGDNVLYVQKAN